MRGDGFADEVAEFVDRRGRVVDCVDDFTVERAGECEIDEGGDVLVVDEAELAGGMQLEHSDELRQRLEVAVFFAIDEAEAEDGPGQARCRGVPFRRRLCWLGKPFRERPRRPRGRDAGCSCCRRDSCST